MTVVAAVRPDDWNFPLFLHVLGAMALVGVLFTVATAYVVAWRRGDEGAALTRLGFRWLLAGAIPAWLLMRLAGQWTASKEGIEEAEVTWLEIGYLTGDIGLPVLVVATVLSGLGLRLARRDGGRGLGGAAGLLAALLLVAYLVATWAMTVKPD